MDIRVPSDSATARVSPITDMLAQLRTAGILEAEVIRTLQGQLLLSSRLGDILTTNTLHYKPGDRLLLRLEGSAQQPVLKASPAPARQVILDSGRLPELNRALPPGRPVLALVTAIDGRRIEILLGSQKLKLSAPLALAKNQLLSLRRDDSRRNIELIPLARKAIYKAIVNQLLPRQADTRPTGLVTLLGLVNKTLAANRPGGIEAILKRADGAGRAAGNPATAAQAGRELRNANSRRSAAVEASPGRLAASSASLSKSLRPAFDTPGPRMVMQPELPAAARSTDRGKPADFVRSGLVATGSRTAMPVPKPVLGRGGGTIASPGIEAAIAGKLHNPAGPVQPRATAKDSIRAGARGRTAAAVSPGNPAIAGSVRAPTQAGPGNSTGVTASPGAGNALQLLLRIMDKFSDIDASRVRHWFEYAGLVRQSGSVAPGASAGEMTTLLRHLADSEGFGRELLRSIRHQTATAGEREFAAGRDPIQESLMLQIRDGIRQVEQSLAQNLLQRASLGLQQETQQPISLSLAVPLLEDHEFKPLHIDIAQRNQAPQEAEQAWDIRLNFEFGDLGVVCCHVVLAGVSIAASFYSEREQTRDRIDSALPQLRQQLVAAGFDPGEFHSFSGRPITEKSVSANDFSESLIDLEV